MTGSPNTTDVQPGVSIVMAVRDNLEWTRKGIESIRANTTHPYELILVDNASQADTAEYLRDAADILVRNEENLGCAAAWNQGIKAATRTHICVVNNDIEVTPRWLERLVELLDRTKYVMVCPVIREGPLDYDLQDFEREICERLGGRDFPSEYRSIAMLTHRDLYEQIGGYDEAYKIGKYEDEDMFMRIRQAGWNVTTTSTVLIHHYGSKTINAEKSAATFDFEGANRKTFLRKWKHRYVARKIRKIRIRNRQRYIKARYGLTY